MTDAGQVARAMALAAVRLGAGDAALARLGGRDGVAARALVQAGGVDAFAAELAAPRPAGWRSIHESWLHGAPPDDGADPAPPTRYLARVAFAARVPMRATGLVALDGNALVRALAILGRRALAHALVGNQPRTIAEQAARLPWGKELLAEVAAIHALGAAAEARLGARVAAQVRLSGLSWGDPLALPQAGARAIAPWVATTADLAEQLAQRLARPVGVVVLAELRAAAAGPPGAGAAEIAAAIGRVTVAPR